MTISYNDVYRLSWSTQSIFRFPVGPSQFALWFHNNGIFLVFEKDRGMAVKVSTDPDETWERTSTGSYPLIEAYASQAEERLKSLISDMKQMEENKRAGEISEKVGE